MANRRNQLAHYARNGGAGGLALGIANHVYNNREEIQGHGQQLVQHFERQSKRARTAAEEEAPTTESAMPTANENGDGQVGGTASNETSANLTLHQWRGFPNEARAALKWMAVYPLDSTNYNSLPPYDAYDQPGYKTATALDSTTGGAFSISNVRGITNYYGGYDFNTPALLQYKMTTPYGCVKQFPHVTNQTALPNWIGLFDSKYQYYHVQQAKWDIHINFGQPSNNGAAIQFPQNMKYHVFYRYTGQDDPPVTYGIYAGTSINREAAPSMSSTQIGITSNLSNAATITMTQDDYFRMGHWNHKSVTLNSTQSAELHISGVYEFGHCDMDVKTMLTTDKNGAQANPTTEGWQLVGNQPNFPENLSIIIVQDSGYCPQPYIAGSSGVLTPCTVTQHIEYDINFKDLQVQYKYPTPGYIGNNASTAYLNTDIIHFTKGAYYS